VIPGVNSTLVNPSSGIPEKIFSSKLAIIGFLSSGLVEARGVVAQKEFLFVGTLSQGDTRSELHTGGS